MISSKMALVFLFSTSERRKERRRNQMSTSICIFFHAVLGLMIISSEIAALLRFLTGKRLNHLPALFSVTAKMGIFTGPEFSVHRARRPAASAFSYLRCSRFGVLHGFHPEQS